jgi:hypothetical protein
VKYPSVSPGVSESIESSEAVANRSIGSTDVFELSDTDNSGNVSLTEYLDFMNIPKGVSAPDELVRLKWVAYFLS